MKTSILTTVALAACLGTQAFAQVSKEGQISFALTLQGQTSVSTSATAIDAGSWSQEPRYYKTGTMKITQATLIKAIGAVYGTNFSSKAELVLVQGELSGFFNVIPGLSNSVASTDGTFDTPITGSSTVIADDTVTQLALDNGRHYQTNPITGLLPVGHFQPWGQIFIKDPGYPGYSANSPLCVNVTYFFNLTVQECYDCFYLNSFISDSAFTIKTTSQSGPPCCGVFSTLLGRGTDRYYLTLGFDDTTVNPYLNPSDEGTYTGFTGIVPTVGSLDGTLPDELPYIDTIKSGLGQPSPYEIRFTLNGILSYTWNLEFVNKTDLLPDFVGTANYAANGYGFVQLVCQLITGTANISEKLLKTPTCCLDIPWYDSWYGLGWDGDPQTVGDIVFESTPTYATDPLATTQENAPLSLSFHVPDWPADLGGVTGY